MSVIKLFISYTACAYYSGSWKDIEDRTATEAYGLWYTYSTES